MMLSGLTVSAQDETPTQLPADNRVVTLPDVGINFGFVNLMSDVRLEDSGPNAFTQFGWQLTVSQRLTDFLSLSLNIFTGTVYGEEMRGLNNLNYRTSLFSQQLNIEYNFYPLLKPDDQGRQMFRPYVAVGGGAMFFRSKGDLKSAEGETYNYWSDGTIRSLAENHPNAEAAVLLERDMIYESDLRDANLDGLRKYPQTTFTLPFHAGLRVQLTKNFGVNAAFTYALNFSELLDNSGSLSQGARQSSSGNDHHMFGSLGINFFIGKYRPSTKRSEPAMLAQSVNRWESRPKDAQKVDPAIVSTDVNAGETDATVKPKDTNSAPRAEGSVDAEMTPGVESPADEQPRVAYREDGAPVNMVATAVVAADGTPIEQLVDADGRPIVAMPTTPSMAYLQDGSAVELITTGIVAVDGTPLEELRDADGNPISPFQAATTVAYRDDGTMVEVMPTRYVAVDGTPIDQLRDANGEAFFPLALKPTLAFREDGSTVEVSPIAFIAADGTPVKELRDSKGKLLRTAPTSAGEAYRKDGTVVQIIPTTFAAADGTPLDRLRDAEGKTFSVESLIPKVAYREDGTSVRLIPVEVIAVDGTPVDQLRDAEGKPFSALPTVPEVAYRQDGSKVRLIPTSVISADGTPMNHLRDAQGKPVSSSATVPKVAFREDGTTVELIPTAFVASDGTPLTQLQDASGKPLDERGIAIDELVTEVIPITPDISSETTTSIGADQRNKGRVKGTPDNITLSDLEAAGPRTSGAFHWADRDKNGYISANEVLYFIDQLFDGDGSLKVEDIQDLIDYYFDQE